MAIDATLTPNTWADDPTGLSIRFDRCRIINPKPGRLFIYMAIDVTLTPYTWADDPTGLSIRSFDAG